MTEHHDGAIADPARAADEAAIRDLAVAYAHAVDDRDWDRWTALFTPDAHIDYRASGGIAGPIGEVAAWMPDALGVFTWTMHSVGTHEIRFEGADRATGRAHLWNVNGVEWEGRSERLDIIGLYLDDYVRIGDSWRFARRAERIHEIAGGEFAAMVRDLAASVSGGSGG